MSTQGTQDGIVLENDGDFAKVRILANSECDNCSVCTSPDMIVTAYNKINAMPGKKVRLTTSGGSMLKISFMLFIFPLISIFAGIYAGDTAARIFNLNHTLFSFLGALFLGVVSVISLVVYDKKFKLNRSNFSVITEVID